MPQRYSESRPRVPADVARRVKVEAGHRCGITHCRDPIFQLHHIDENRGNNDPANLIPLCGTHHALAHAQSGAPGRITSSDLRHYKQRLAEIAGSSTLPGFVRSEEARRVSVFTQAIRELFTWHDGESISGLDTEYFYWFPIEAYEKLSAFLASEAHYPVDLRSFDQDAAEHQDAIMTDIRQMVNQVNDADHWRSGYCITYRPEAKANPNFGAKVDRERARFGALARDLLERLDALDGYTRWRPGD